MSADLAGPSVEAVSPFSSESTCPFRSTEPTFSFKFVRWLRTAAMAALNISAKAFAEVIFWALLFVEVSCVVLVIGHNHTELLAPNYVRA